jgi:hypothetical protein
MRRVALIAALAAMVLFGAASVASADTKDGPMGSYVGAGVGGIVQGNTVAGVFVGHWWETFGVQGGFSVLKSKIDFEQDGTATDQDFTNTTSYSFGLVGKAGVPVGRAKPYMGIGFRYETSDFKAANREQSIFYMVPSVGVDIRVSEHIMLGIVLVSVPVIVDGKFEFESPNGAGDTTKVKGDLDGYEVRFLSSFGISYLF